MIKNVNSGKYLDVAGGTAANGTNVQQWSASAPGAYYNTWKIVSEGSGYYKIYSQVGDGNTYLLDLANGSTGSGTNIQIWQNTYSDAQTFKLQKNDDGSYAILTKSTGAKSGLDVAGGSTSNGANVQQWGYGGGNHQNWIFEEVASDSDITNGGIYMIKNVNSGKYLDVAGGVSANGTNVQQWSASEPGAYYNTWKFVSEGDGYYKIYSQVGNGNTYLLDVANGSTGSGTNIQIWQNTYSDAQTFKIQKNDDGTYAILTKVTGAKSGLDIASGSTSNGANVQQWGYGGSANQKWELIKVN